MSHEEPVLQGPTRRTWIVEEESRVTCAEPEAHLRKTLPIIKTKILSRIFSSHYALSNNEKFVFSVKNKWILQQVSL